MKISIKLKIPSIFLLFALFSPSVLAELDMHIAPGIGGYHKHGRWLPLQITLTDINADMTGNIEVEFQDGQADSKEVYSASVALFRAIGKTQHLYTFPKNFRRNLQVKLMDDSRKAIFRKDTTLKTIPQEDKLIFAISRSGSGLEFLANRSDKAPNTHIAYSSSSLIPEKWKGYDAVDVIILGNISLNSLQSNQQQAIVDWVYSGGQLIVSGGAYSQELIGSFIEKLLPVKITGTRVLNSLPFWPQKSSGSQIVVTASELSEDGKIIFAESDGLPIIAEKEAGNGKVNFLAFDYLEPILHSWDGYKDIWEVLLPQPEITKQLNNKNIVRLLSDNNSAKPSLYRHVGIFLLLYILLVWPINYAFLKKTKKWRLWWLTMPVISIIFIMGALGFTHASRSSAVILNDFSIIDVYSNMERIRINSYLGLFSRVESHHIVEFPEADEMFVSRMQLSLHKRSEKNGDCRFIEKDAFRIEMPNTEALTSQLFHGEAYVDFERSVSINLSESSGNLVGEVVNYLPFDLSDCHVFSNGRLFYMGNLASGDHSRIKMKPIHAGNISNLYSKLSKEKKQFVNAMKPDVLLNIPDTGIIGWVEQSALEALAGMKMGMEYRAMGTALIIVHL